MTVDGPNEFRILWAEEALMPGGAGKPKRACPMCKHYKYLGNSKGRRKPSDQRRDEDYRQQREAA